MGKFGTELFPEDVEAWPHGPIVRNLYTEFKAAKKSSITALNMRFQMLDGKTARVTPKHDGWLDNVIAKIGEMAPPPTKRDPYKKRGKTD